MQTAKRRQRRLLRRHWGARVNHNFLEIIHVDKYQKKKNSATLIPHLKNDFGATWVDAIIP